MTIETLKREIHKKIDGIDDSALLEAIYTILNQRNTPARYTLSPEQQEELDKRLELHDSGKAKYYSATEMRKKVTGKRKK